MKRRHARSNPMEASSRRSFGSDNNAPVAPEILQAIVAANAGDAVGYGEDAWTARAIGRFKSNFGERTDVYFTFNGTGANVAALAAVLRPWEAVLAPASAHLQTDECGAFERFADPRSFRFRRADGKLRPADLEPFLRGKGDVHFPQPRADLDLAGDGVRRRLRARRVARPLYVRARSRAGRAYGRCAHRQRRPRVGVHAARAHHRRRRRRAQLRRYEERPHARRGDVLFRSRYTPAPRRSFRSRRCSLVRKCATSQHSSKRCLPTTAAIVTPPRPTR